MFQDPNFKNTGFDYDKDTDRALSAKVVGKETVADVYNVKPDLTRYAAMGHKLIMYHGWADQQISPYASIDFYQRIVAKLGQAKADAFLKFYMLPGIYHCAGGPGAGNFGAAGPASAPDAQHDITVALDEWVTEKKAPDLFHRHAYQRADQDGRPHPAHLRLSAGGEIQRQRRHQRRRQFHLRRAADLSPRNLALAHMKFGDGLTRFGARVHRQLALIVEDHHCAVCRRIRPPMRQA